MRYLFTALALLTSFSFLCQDIDYQETKTDHYDHQGLKNATAGKYIGSTISIIGGGVYASRVKNGASEIELNNTVSIIVTGAVVSLVSELIMDLQVLNLGEKKSVRKPSHITTKELDTIRKAIASRPDGVYIYNKQKTASFIFKSQSKDTNSILIYFDQEREIGEKWIDPMSDKLIWFNKELRTKFYVN